MQFIRPLASVVCLTVLAISHACAAYPDKVVRIVVAYPPGGAVDVVARRLAQKLSDQTGKSFVVENKAGATGTIGTAQVARSAADGYTLLAIDNTYSMLPYVFKKLPWDHEKAFTPVSIAVVSPVVMLARTEAPFKDVPGLIAYARANPDKVRYGSGGSGSTLHFYAEAFQQVAGVKLYHVPYKGGGDALLAVLSNETDITYASTPSAMSQLQSGRMRALAVTSSRRLAGAPSLPTFAEVGLPSYRVTSWSGLAAPAGTPAEVVARLYAEVKGALASPDMEQFFTGIGSDPAAIDPQASARLINEETARWAAVARTANIEQQ